MMPTIRTVAMRSYALGGVSKRAFSSNCEPAQRIKCIFEEYRRQHFSRETPNRFRKELLKAAETASCPKGTVEVDSLNKILVNIGRPEEKLTEEELNAILREAGCTDRAIPVDKMIQLM